MEVVEHPLMVFVVVVVAVVVVVVVYEDCVNYVDYVHVYVHVYVHDHEDVDYDHFVVMKDVIHYHYYYVVVLHYVGCVVDYVCCVEYVDYVTEAFFVFDFGVVALGVVGSYYVCYVDYVTEPELDDVEHVVI